MATSTQYMRNDTHTINSLLANKLGTTDTTGVSPYLHRPDNGGTITYDYDVLIRHSNGTTTSVGTGVAQTSRVEGNGYGFQTATWACPSTSMVSTDAIELIMNIGASGAYAGNRYFITSQLGWSKLEASTWTIKRYTANIDCYGYTGGSFYWGGSSGDPLQDNTDCKITGISYTTYSDIGLRVYDGSSVVKIGTQALDGHALRVRKGATTYGIPLIATNDGSACGIRIYDGSNVKSVPEV